MKVLKLARYSLCLSVLFAKLVYGQSNQDGFVSVSLQDLGAFNNPGKNWVLSSNPKIDYLKANDLKPVAGTGVLVNAPTGNDHAHLFSKEEFGDLQLELDFMMAKNSNSGIFLQGRYEIQLFDSWTQTDPTYADCGGIYARSFPDKGNIEGSPPLVNAAKAPGLWQHLNIKFRAPKFNDKGVKIADARFEEVYLNGVLIQEEATVTGPTGVPFLTDEKALAPLVFQGDHGLVAFRNIKYRKTWQPTPEPKGDQYWIPGSPYWQTVDPMVVTPTTKPTFIKTFLMNGDKKLTHVLSVGSPRQLNYSYDLKQGAIFQVWRGAFLDLSMSWRDRGGMQLAQPLGSLITLSDAPVLAVLPDEKTAWPDSVPFDDMNNKGYVLDKQRSPTYSYAFKGIEAKDNIVLQTNGEGISRTITAETAVANLYCRIAAGSTIESLGADLYSVNDKSYYIKLDPKYKPLIRKTEKGQEIIVKYVPANPVTYSIIW